MKIASGLYKGKNLIVPKKGVRPTSDKVRQALINIIRPHLRGANFMDLFAGTGAVGIEALSNGAEYACFVEDSWRMVSIIKENLDNLVKDHEKYAVITHNASGIKSQHLNQAHLPFDIIFADPFYKDAQRKFDSIYELAFELLSENGIFIYEHGSTINFNIYPGLKETRRYGDTYLSFFTKHPEGETE